MGLWKFPALCAADLFRVYLSIFVEEESLDGQTDCRHYFIYCLVPSAMTKPTQGRNWFQFHFSRVC